MRMPKQAHPRLLEEALWSEGNRGKTDFAINRSSVTLDFRMKNSCPPRATLRYSGQGLTNGFTNKGS